jgi:hypothetical protein
MGWLYEIRLVAWANEMAKGYQTVGMNRWDGYTRSDSWHEPIKWHESMGWLNEIRLVAQANKMAK